jgi:hypothetical protein
MALIASIESHFGMTIRGICTTTCIPLRRLYKINEGRGKPVKYMEQVALEQMLPSETVAKLHCRYYATPVETFWDKLLTQGDTHARR